eukprot:TRINITY_DN3766_c0_g1_i1.p1 TRINITY_DN3766_c0_g1~~TRINITY_DN3766_c0_g1_i1.p1  ORF type:complete len:513 (+),score=82.04 TRINITY_DN3766_c0_g1_i1:190-1539(+)
MEEKIKREIKALSLFRHPHIIKLYEVIETPSNIYMIMEYVSGGELFDYIVQNGKLSEDEARRFFQQIISGVEYCHKHMVAHRDLKPENLILDSNANVKIADFGLSNSMRDGDFLKTSCGSPNYAAPEVISGNFYVGPEVDVWSCGVILYALLCAKLPFDDEVIPQLFKKIREGIFTLPEHLSPESKQLISSMLVVDPLKRITIDEIREHPWFLKNLPDYLRYSVPIMSKTLIQSYDDEVLDELTQKLGASREKVVQELRQAELNGSGNNEFVVAYRLIYDSRKAYLFTSTCHNHEQVKDSKSNFLELSVSPPLNLRDETPFIPDSAKIGRNGIDKNSVFNSFDVNQINQKPDKWCLGLISSLPPKQIMTEIMRILVKINFEWKIVPPYQIRCRNKEQSSTRPLVRIAIQLYKLKDGTYLIDFKIIQGNVSPFFESAYRMLHEFQSVLCV